jgi:putative restriction endonuclease
MNSYIGITDKQWFSLLRSQQGIDEVNFWLPSGRGFRVLSPGDLFLFKLHYPDNYIVGGGLFAHYTILPVSLAWEAFGIKNGAVSLNDLREKIDKYRKQESNPFEDYQIGCILLEQPFFLPEEKWIPAPRDWPKNIVSGKSYDLTVEPGATIFRQLSSQLIQPHLIRETPARYGEPILVQPRLGQGSFRVLVTDAYNRRCAVSSERTLPVLEAAHIKPYSELGEHKVTNGILLRQDIHTLFDKGYLTITPELNIEVSRRIREEFENGRDYYKYNGQPMRPPQNWIDRPSREHLAWHNETIYRG